MAKNTTGLTLQALRRKTKLSFGGRGAYEIESLESGQFTEAEIRQEYSRLRSTMKKRLERLEASEWSHEGRTTPKSLSMESYPTLKELGSMANVRKALKELATAIESPLSTKTGLEQLRDRSLETLYAHYPEMKPKYDENTGELLQKAVIGEENFIEFGDFMDYARKTMGDRKLYSNEEWIALFGEHVKKESSFEDLKQAFDAWLDVQVKKADKIPEVKR